MNNPVAEIHFVATHSAAPTYPVMRPASHEKPATMPGDAPIPRLHVVSRVSRREPPGESVSPALTSSADARALFESSLDAIEGAIRFVCHRNRLDPAEAEEFESEVKLRFVEKDYEILRRFQHRSSLRTYLVVVIQRQFLDYRNHLWGKWRSSAEATRLGPVAIALERMLVREGLDLDQAGETLRTNEGVAVSREELAAIASRLPVRIRRSVVGEEALETFAEERQSPEAGVIAGEPSAIGARIRFALAPAVQAFSDQDRLILRLRFQDDLGVADIARALHLDQKPLYRRFESLLRRLREALEAAGIDRDTARDAISRKDVDISLALLGETRAIDRPSNSA